VPLAVIAQQHLRHRQAHQLGVGHLRPLARPGAGKVQRGDDAVGQLHIERDQESVQVDDHDDLARPSRCLTVAVFGFLIIRCLRHRVGQEARDLALMQMSVVERRYRAVLAVRAGDRSDRPHAHPVWASAGTGMTVSSGS